MYNGRVLPRLKVLWVVAYQRKVIPLCYALFVQQYWIVYT